MVYPAHGAHCTPGGRIFLSEVERELSDKRLVGKSPPCDHGCESLRSATAARLPQGTATLFAALQTPKTGSADGQRMQTYGRVNAMNR